MELNTKALILKQIEEAADWTFLEKNPEYNDDKDIVNATMNYSYGLGLKYASDELRDDRDFVLETVKKHGGAFQHASERLRDDKEIAIIAVRHDGWYLKYASERLRNDKEVVCEACMQDADQVDFAGPEVKAFFVDCLKNALNH